jgi:hypothetical protein
MKYWARVRQPGIFLTCSLREARWKSWWCVITTDPGGTCRRNRKAGEAEGEAGD